MPDENSCLRVSRSSDFNLYHSQEDFVVKELATARGVGLPRRGRYAGIFRRPPIRYS
jgi:hypothetical protein